MATVAPFRGVHYPPGRALHDLLAPPYDVISDAEHRKLCATHAHNIIHLTLGAADTRRNYRQIGAKLKRWMKDGVLVQDPVPNFYAYCQEWEYEGHMEKFWGILAMLKLEPFGAGKIFPHEAVMPGPVEDRLKIMEGTGANLEPIISLYRAPADPMTMLFESLEVMPPSLAAAYEDGSRHRLWKLSAPRTRARIQRTLKPLPFFIADGHHRYHAAWIFRQRHRRLRTAQWMLSLVANTEQRGLKILPYHRIVTCETKPAALLPQIMSRFGRIERLGSRLPGAIPKPGRHAVGFFTRAAGGWILHLPPPAAGITPRDTLEVTRLHELLPQLVRIKALTFTKNAEEAAQAARKSPVALACFLPAPTSQHITTIAFGGETLPQKSTFFRPKPLSGLVLRLL